MSGVSLSRRGPPKAVLDPSLSDSHPVSALRTLSESP